MRILQHTAKNLMIYFPACEAKEVMNISFDSTLVDFYLNEKNNSIKCNNSIYKFINYGEAKARWEEIIELLDTTSKSSEVSIKG